MGERRVFVTGMGLMTGLGLDMKSTWEGILRGDRPAGRFTLFDPSEVDAPVGVELPDGADDLFKKHIKPRSRKQMTRGTRMSLVCAAMAIEDSGLDVKTVDRQRIGVVAGATGTGYAPPTNERDGNRILRNMASSPAAWISLKLGFLGPSSVVSSACSSGTYALHAAWMLIQSGECDVVVAGAADSTLNALDVQGFCDLMALAVPDDGEDPRTLSRPFHKDRKGFVMGEGGGMMVLESEESARARGARIRALLHRPGLSSEGYNILSPEPGGTGMARTMSLALDAAGLKPGNIGYVNAHGTSTQLNDLYETQAIKAVFGDHAHSLAVSSTKAAHGHCLAAAAGVETVLSVLALENGVIPPTLNLTEVDSELDLDYVPLSPREQRLDHVMCNSFAFGGQNGVSIFSRYE
ncbi:MAG: beta-ketoacyl-[acyl-carrier-protein] synthase family protein [Deltaproteobacteria bacterium]|nr:beta-ketoacyl-[acyl-carrier-protein] synthase family protein [Deltaproteobacteria bacterium]